MNTMKKLLSVFAVMLLTMPMAMAQAPVTKSLGSMIGKFGSEIWKPTVYLMVGASMLVGFFLVGSALLKIVQGVGRDDIKHKEVIMRLLGGGFLVSFWDTMQLGPLTLWGSMMTMAGWKEPTTAPGRVNDCMAATTPAITCMAENFTSNVVPVFMNVAWCMAFVFGAWLILTAIHQYATASEGGGGQQGKPLPRFLFGVILLQLPLFISSVSTSLGYADPVVTSSGMVASNTMMLKYDPPPNWGLLSNYSALIGYVFIITAMFGVIAVWKGVTFLKADAEGIQRGVVGAGLTHIIGGVMLINSKATVCFIANSILGSGLSFC